MSSSGLGFRNQVVLLKWVRQRECFKGEKLDLSRECHKTEVLLDTVNLKQPYKCYKDKASTPIVTGVDIFSKPLA
jgi:hypothetical protein